MNQSLEPIAYRIDDFCRVMGLGRTKVYALIKNEQLRSVRVAGRTLIPASEATRLLSEAR
jgi:excisionase family DNA binding protein